MNDRTKCVEYVVIAGGVIYKYILERATIMTVVNIICNSLTKSYNPLHEQSSHRAVHRFVCTE